MSIEFVKKQRPVPEQAVEALERKLGIEFPDDYRFFLIVYNGGKPVKDRFSWTGKSGKVSSSMVDWFLTCGSHRHIGFELYFHRYRGRMPSELVPIAFDPGGNQVCLSCAGADRGAVYFWDHEQEAMVVGEEQPYRGNLRFIAGSFTEFIESLTNRRT